MTAQEQYKNTRKEISSLIKQLNQLLDLKDKTADKDSENWGHAGDLGYIKEQLTIIVNFLK